MDENLIGNVIGAGIALKFTNDLLDKPKKRRKKRKC